MRKGKKSAKIAAVLLDCAAVQGTWVQVRVQFKAKGKMKARKRGRFNVIKL